MAAICPRDARRLSRHLQIYAEGLTSANELFPLLLDSSPEGLVSETLEAAGPEVREQVRSFLAGRRPATFEPFVIGQQPTVDVAMAWEEERRRKYAGLLRALALRDPRGVADQRPGTT